MKGRGIGELTLLTILAVGPAVEAGGIRFEEVAEEAGVEFVHTARSFSGPHGQVLEMFTEGGAVVAVGDFDSDGDDDLYLLDSQEAGKQGLFRNDGHGRFTEVGARAGVSGGNGPETLVSDALWLDYDNDGHLDLLASRLGPPVLYRNLGGSGSPTSEGPWFVPVTEAVGLGGRQVNTFASITFDADGDGWLDLILGHYFQPVNLFDLDTTKVLPNDLDRAINGGGVTFWKNVPKPGAPGGRAFVDKTAEAGLSHHTGWSLDLGHADLDNDGDQDFYMAGDYGTDRLFINRGDGTFDDVTEKAIGFDTRKGMNVDMGDYNRDGYLDIYVTNITDEYMKECNMLWHNNGDGTFVDLSRETGTCDTDWGWAGKFADFDNDGWEDLFVVNGLRSAGERNYIPVLLETILTPNIDFSDLRSYPNIEEMTWSGYQKQRFFHNLSDGTFKEIAGAAGVDNELDGRGVGIADFDGDGRLDIYQANCNRRGLLYRNVTESPGRWIQLRLVGNTRGEKRSNRDAIGARVTLTAGGETWIREVNGGNGFSSQSSLRLHFGLGDAKRIDKARILWPSGRLETFEAEAGESLWPLDGFVTVTEAEGWKKVPARSEPSPPSKASESKSP